MNVPNKHVFFNRKNDDNLFELRKPSSFREISNMVKTYPTYVFFRWEDATLATFFQP